MRTWPGVDVTLHSTLEIFTYRQTGGVFTQLILAITMSQQKQNNDSSFPEQNLVFEIKPPEVLKAHEKSTTDLAS